MCVKTVAELTASVAGSSQCEPIAAGKLVNKKARPTRAGLNTFEPMPPKNSFAITIAKKAPKTVIHTGRAGGKVNAKSKPVTTDERSFILTGRLNSFCIRNSKTTQERVETAMFNTAGRPKSMPPYTAKGIRLTMTMNIVLCVVRGVLKCGLVDM